MFSKASVGVLAAATMLSGLALSAPSAAADFADVIPSQNPVDFSPRILENPNDPTDDVQARTLAEVGDRIVVGGNFRFGIQNYNSSTVFPQRWVFAFNPSTGRIDEDFFPNVNGEVNAVLAHPDGNKVYIAGSFTQVNGEAHTRIALLNLNTGNPVSTFDPPNVSAAVTSMRLANGQLYIGGDFAFVGQTERRALASLDPNTGALTEHVVSDISGTLFGAGSTSIKAFDITPDGSKLVAIGNFNTVDGQTRTSIAVWNTGGATATLRDWATQRYGDYCNQVFPTYLRDIDIAPNGKFFVVVTTGSYRGNVNLCDTAARWDLAGTGTNKQPSWVNYTGGDTLTGVEVTGPMAYLGGHMRWLNNPFRGDAAGSGAWPTEGLAVVDTRNGLPFSWNPGRARGLGVFDFLPTDPTLWAVSDTNTWADEFRPRLAGFPFNNNTIPPDVIGRLPGDVWQLGAIPGGGASEQRGIGFDGTTVETQMTEPGEHNWANVRGAFAVDDTVYTVWDNGTSGSLAAQSWDGHDFGPLQDIELYEGTPTTPGYSSNFINDLESMTGIFYEPVKARIYYTMQGRSELFWRPFLPENRLVGATRRVLPNATALTPNRVKGMFKAGKFVYFADSQNGRLKRVQFVNNKFKGSARLANEAIDWRANALFLSSQWATLAENVAPVATFSADCTGLTCTVDATQSTDADGGVVEYSVDFGDGFVSDDPAAVHTYGADGLYDITVTVTDNRGASNSTTSQVDVAQLPNVLPTAAFEVDCWGLDCDFDASTSVDTDGSIVDYAWNFGDVNVGSGAQENNVYASGGTFDVVLTITDDRGGIASSTQTITVNPIATSIDFRDAVSVDGGGNTSASITVPNTVETGDLMLLFVTNGAERTPDTPTNWTSLGSQIDDQLRTHVYWRFASPGAAGSQVTTTLRDGANAAAAAPEVTTLVAYSGVNSPPVSNWQSRAEPSTAPVTSHTTPGLSVPDPGAWVVSYWADRTNSAGGTPTSAWTTPLDQVLRADAFNTNTTPRVSSLLTDDGGPVLAGARSGLTAEADVAAEKATMFTIVLDSQ